MAGTPCEAILGVLAEGQVLDNTYRIVRLIGEGGMGLVYEASHSRLAGRYAIKVLLRKLSESPDSLARFNREARITSSLQHPNIVQVIDFNTHTDGTEYLVMEYLQGETLAKRLARGGALPLDQVVSVVEQVAAGLAAAHSHNVVHRDLKPDNVFLVPIAGRHHELAKVLDFGISKARDVNHGLRGPESALMGTPQYMSPEQCQGRTAAVDATTDQFALAVITYEMLTGRAPFSGDSVGAVLAQVLYANPPPTNLHPEIEAVVRRGLAKSGTDRFSDVTAFATALRAAVSSQLAPSTHTDDVFSEVDRRTNLLATLSGDLAGDVSRAVLDPAMRDKMPRRNTRRRWGAAALGGGAVAVGMFFVMAANTLEHERTQGMLPLAAAPSAQVTAVTLQPSKVPSSILAAPPPRTDEEPVMSTSFGGAPGTRDGVKIADHQHREFERREAARMSMEREEAEQRELERRIAERRELEERELERRPVRSDNRPLEHRMPAPASGTAQSATTPTGPAHSGPMDDDAILPLDDSVGTP